MANQHLVKAARKDKRKRWMDHVKEDLHQRGGDVQQAAELSGTGRVGRNLSVSRHI